jgi:hypothetical protein
MTKTTQVRVYESDKKRIDEIKDDLNTATLLRDALDALERERGRDTDE